MYTIDQEIFTIRKISYAEQLVYAGTVYAYMCDYRIKVASYTGFHLKCRIMNSSQVKLAVSSNTE